MRRILHVYRDGKYAAIDNPGAVVVDYDAKMIRIGLERWPMARPVLFKFIAFMLRSADVPQCYEAINAAVRDKKLDRAHLSRLARDSEAILEALGMTIETIDEVGYQLHTDPRRTLECCETLAPGLPPPSRVRSTRCGLGGQYTIPEPSLIRSIRRLEQSSRKRRNSPRKSF